MEREKIVRREEFVEELRAEDDNTLQLDESAQAVLDAIILERFDLAEARLGALKQKLGESPLVTYLSGKLSFAKGDLPQAYKLFKFLYYEAPVFMGKRPDYHDLCKTLLDKPIEKARVQWQSILDYFQELIESDDNNTSEQPIDFYKIQSKLIPEIQICLDIYKKILEIEPMHVEAIHGLLVCYSEIGKADLVLQLKDRLQKAQEYWIEMNRRRAQHLWVECKALVSAERFEDAIRIASLGVDHSPIYHSLTLLKGETLYRMGRTLEALACAETLLRMNEKDNEALRLKKNVELLHLEELIANGEECLYFAEEQLPGCKAQLRKAQEALAYFLEALTADPYNLSALVGAYKCHKISNNPLKAQEIINRIREIDPDYPIEAAGVRNIDVQEKTEPCFVATRLFGERAPETCILRRFRDEKLIYSPLGRVAVTCYRHIGPPLAGLSPTCPLIKPVRNILRFFTRLLAIYYKL